MKRIRHLASRSVSAALALLCAATSLQAQATIVWPTQAQGMFSNWPLGLSLGSSGTEELHIRALGTASGVPVAWTSSSFSAAGPNHPDYSTSALTNHWNPSSLPTAPRFGGISTGGDQMPSVSDTGVLNLEAENWYSISFTVAPDARGKQGSLLESRAAGALDPSGDIFTYYTIGSTAIHPEFPDTIRLEASRAQLQLRGAAPGPVENRAIRNLDYGIGVISVDPEARAVDIFPVTESFYFSLTKAWVTEAMQLNPSGYLIAGQVPSEATVYSMQWVNGSWTEPAIAFTHQELFGVGCTSPHCVEIDALTVDQGSVIAGWPHRVVFSLTPASDEAPGGPFDQLLVYQRGMNPVPCPTTSLKVQTPGGNKRVTDHVGLGDHDDYPSDGPDDITSTCGIDPDESSQEGPVVGIATEDEHKGDGKLGLSAFRSDTPSDPTNEDVVHLQVTGLDFPGYELGFIQLYLEGPVPEKGSEPASGTPSGPPIWIDPASAANNALDLVLPTSHAVGGTHFRVSARLIGVNLSPFDAHELRESWVITSEI